MKCMQVCINLFVFHVMALSKFAGSSTLLDFPTFPSGPNHPSSSFKFPHHEFGKKQIVKRSCQLSWFIKWKWLDYDEESNVVFCHP